MTDKEIRKLSRAELLEMLIEQSKEVQMLREKLAAAEEALRNKEIAIDKAGSIAEAALMLNGVFEAAQLACKQYTDNIKELSQRQEAVCTKMEADSRMKAQQLIEQAEKKQKILETTTKANCDEMIAKAKSESQRYWDEVSAKLEAFYAEHAGLRELLSFVAKKKT